MTIQTSVLLPAVQEVIALTKTPAEAVKEWDDAFQRYMKEKGMPGF
jgi:predicted RNase H-like HicB family nuclease